MFLQLLSKRKENMYCDYQLYPHYVAPQMTSRPSSFNSAQLFQVISVALDRNLNDYLSKKMLQRAQRQTEVILAPSEAKVSETVIIDLQSEQSLSSPVGTIGKDAQYNSLKLSPVQETFLQSSHKEEILGGSENQIISQTHSDLQKEKKIKQNREIQQKTEELKCLKKMVAIQEFTLFSVDVPKLGISNAQLLRKKQKLLRRKVTDWADVDLKCSKQRREIRMLKN